MAGTSNVHVNVVSTVTIGGPPVQFTGVWSAGKSKMIVSTRPGLSNPVPLTVIGVPASPVRGVLVMRNCSGGTPIVNSLVDATLPSVGSNAINPNVWYGISGASKEHVNVPEPDTSGVPPAHAIGVFSYGRTPMKISILPPAMVNPVPVAVIGVPGRPMSGLLVIAKLGTTVNVFDVVTVRSNESYAVTE